MSYSQTINSLVEVVLVLVPSLVGIAYVTVGERKTMGSMQRRLGPNAVGIYGLLQAFADALKLLLKEYVGPTQANLVLFFLGPVITLIFSLLGYAVIPYGPGLAVNDLSTGILYMLAVSSLATYGILLAGFYFFKSPFSIRMLKYNPIEFQENLNIRQLEAKPTLFTNSCLKYERSTTSKLLKELIILPRVIGVLNSFLRVPFLITIYIWPIKAWLKFHNIYLLFLYYFAYFTSLTLTFVCILINQVLSFVRSTHTNKSRICNPWNIRSKLSEVKLNTSIFVNINESLNCNNKFKRFYSTKSNYSGDPGLSLGPGSGLLRSSNPDLLSNDEFSLDKASLYNSNKDFNFEEEDLKALHSLYIKDLFKDRVAPVIPFDSNLILASFNLSDSKERSEFLKEWGSKGGIYLIEYKYNPLVYYIGRTTLFKRRINNHINAETNSKFHVFLRLIGLEHFKFSIVEICSPSEQGKRENYYLQKFLPLLNSTFSSSFTESAIYMSLRDKLTSLKPTTLTQKSNQPIPIFTYTLCKDKGINPTYIKYNSIGEASRKEKIAYGTVLLFRDTNVPFRNKLYYTKPIIDFNSTLDQVNSILKDVKITSNIAQKVWAYDAKTLNLIKGSPFESKTQASNTLGISRYVISYFIDTNKPEGVKGTYLFSKPLEESEIQSLKKLSEDIRLGNKIKVWAYDATTLDLINNEPFPSISDAADYFKVNYRTIKRHLDTKVATKQNKMSVYFFKMEINSDLKMELMKQAKKFHYARGEIWAYKLEEGKKKIIT
jgi:hypothetical protein